MVYSHGYSDECTYTPPSEEERKVTRWIGEAKWAAGKCGLTVTPALFGVVISGSFPWGRVRAEIAYDHVRHSRGSPFADTVNNMADAYAMRRAR